MNQYKKYKNFDDSVCFSSFDRNVKHRAVIEVLRKLKKCYHFAVICNFYARWPSRKEHLLASSCPSVCPSLRLPASPFAHLSACVSAAPTGQSSVKFDTGDFYENLWRKSRFGWNWTKFSDTFHKNLSTFSFVRDNKLPQMSSLQQK
jgi:hypothetical protein